MPGLNQLKKFSDDVANLGNELTIREERGEAPVKVALPDVPDIDDSDDFVLGMPQDSLGDEPDESLDFSDDMITGAVGTDDSSLDTAAFPELDSLLNPVSDEDLDLSGFPELDDILGGGDATVDSDTGSAELDVDAFDGLPAEPAETVASVATGDTPPAETVASVATEDAPPAADIADGFSLPDFDIPDFSDDPASVEDIPDADGISESDSFVADNSFADEEASSLASFEEPSVSVPDAGDASTDSFDDLPEIPDFDDLPSMDDIPSLDGTGDDSGMALDAFDEPAVVDDSMTEETSAVQDVPVDDIPSMDDLPEISDISFDDIDDVPAVESASVADGDMVEEFPSDEAYDDSTGAASDAPVSGDDGGSDGFDLPEIPDFDVASDFSSGVDSAEQLDNLDEIPSFSVDTDDAVDGGDIDFAAFDVPDTTDDALNGMDVPEDVFDVPDDPFGDASSVSDNVEEGGLSDTPFDDFDIPGFSDQSAGEAKARPSPKDDARREKNTLSDSEYETFRKNLANYPLNLRVAIQEFIVNDEFKDSVVFEVVQKVLKKASARQIAQQLEKLLDISIPVPRDFERRTFEQYEEYKKSAEYQLKNRIIPAAMLTVMAGCILFLLVLFGRNVVYRPLKAESLYKEGFALLESGAYPQSELVFNEALEYQQKKKWFLRYADGYRQHKQYERARMMFKSGLQRFKHDKGMGLQYARMELDDLRNFEEAERVVRREVLDYHINDKDGMLLLGDIFLEWGDEKNPDKYEDARLIYAELLQLYGQQDLYLARMMRYFIRVDDLRNVLQLKGYFYPRKKSLGGQDLVELSGYLLNELYGGIAPADEYLLSSIENVRELLERAVAAAPDIPESLYNMGLYFVHTNNSSAAKDWMVAAANSFETVEYRPRRRLLKQVNTYRLLGELFAEEHEFITAEEYFRTGTELFETEKAAGLVGDRNVGLLYADLADLHYFVSGDLDEALDNYLVAVATENDTPSIRYRIGYIQYSKKRYSEALGSFIKTADSIPSDTHVLLALGNVLSARGDNFAAQGYYERLMQLLDAQRSRYGIMFPQTNIEHADVVELYLKAANNLGVTLYRLARQTGDSALNASAMTNLSASVRAWDALTRNQETMVRLPGSNLAERNIAYMSYPVTDYEPSIYTEIPRMLSGEVVPD